MVQYLENYKKNIAIDMRKRGFSYSDIYNKMNIPKSTIVSWVKDVKLTKEQKEKLKKRRTEIARTNFQKRNLRTAKLIESIKLSSAQNIAKISKRELWLMGIALYWKERLASGDGSDLKNGVRFTSSDPDLVKIFIKWLREVGEIDDEEIKFDIFIGEDKKSKMDDTKNYWAYITGFPRGYFPRVYFQKKYPVKKIPKNKARNYSKSEFGFLRVGVRSSSMLARQIAGWAEAIK